MRGLCCSLLSCALWLGNLEAQNVQAQAAVSPYLAMLYGYWTTWLAAGTPLTHGMVVAAGPSRTTVHLAQTPIQPTYQLRWFGRVVPLAPNIQCDAGTLLTLQSQGTTAAQLELVCTLHAVIPPTGGIPGSSEYYLRGTIDVYDDGVPEVSFQGYGERRSTLDVRVGPGALPVRTAMVGWTAPDAWLDVSLALGVTVREVLTAIATTHVPGCGAQIAVEPTTRLSLRVAVAGMQRPVDLAVLLVSLGRANVVLPCGGCVLAVPDPVPVALPLDAGGNGNLELGVPPSLLPATIGLQAAGVSHLAVDCLIRTTEAIEVRLLR